MPMVGHHAVVTNPHRNFALRFIEHHFEGDITARLVKQTLPSGASIEIVEDHTPGAARLVLGMIPE